MAPVVLSPVPRLLHVLTKRNRELLFLSFHATRPTLSVRIDARAVCTAVPLFKSSHVAATLVDEGDRILTTTSEEDHKDPLDLTFTDHEAAFKSKTTSELLRAMLVFKLCSMKVLVANNEKLLRIGPAVFGKTAFGYLMKATFYGHFVAGEDQKRIQPTLERLRSFGVKSILDYSVEEDISQEKAEEREMELHPLRSMPASPHVYGIATLGTAQLARFHSHSAATGSCESLSHHDDENRSKRYAPQRKFADRRHSVMSARTYFYVNEAQCEKNMETFLNCIDAVSDATFGTGFAAIKMTALGRPQLLMQLSEVIERSRLYFKEVTGKSGGAIISHDVSKNVFEKRFREEHILTDNPGVKKWLENMTYDHKGLIHLFSWSGLIDTNILLQDLFKVPNLKSGKLEPLITALSKEEEEMFKNMMRRLHTIFKYAKERDVRVMVDAEQTYFQPAISRLTMELMKKYNQEKAIVFNTYQCYLKEAYNTLRLDLEQCRRQNFYFGAKLVRGAYMVQEHERALELRYEDPINPGYEATTNMYHQCLEECMKQITSFKKEGNPLKVAAMVASHNEDTVRHTVRQMAKYNIHPLDRVICFGQLLGMCDHISLPLGQAGFSVYKYVPYGPVNEVLPYLSRRATENSSILEKLQKEKMLLRRELLRRIVSGQLFYTPKGDYLPVGAQV